MVVGISTIDDSVIDMAGKTYFKNNNCLIGFKLPKKLKYCGSTYRNIIGFHIDPDKEMNNFEIGYKDGSSVNLSIGKPETITVSKVDASTIEVVVKTV